MGSLGGGVHCCQHPQRCCQVINVHTIQYTHTSHIIHIGTLSQSKKKQIKKNIFRNIFNYHAFHTTYQYNQIIATITRNFQKK